jgi:alanyl-tRNA synthetase
MTRISFLAGRRLLQDSRRLRRNALVVSQALSVPVNETGKGVLESLEKTTQNEKRLKTLEEKVVRLKAETLLRKAVSLTEQEEKRGEKKSQAIIIETYADEDINTVINIGKTVQKQCGAVFILASEPDRKFTAFSAAGDLRILVKDSLEAYGGRGGGSAAFFQGSFVTKEAMNSFLKAIKQVEGIFNGDCDCGNRK